MKKTQMPLKNLRLERVRWESIDVFCESGVSVCFKGIWVIYPNLLMCIRCLWPNLSILQFSNLNVLLPIVKTLFVFFLKEKILIVKPQFLLMPTATLFDFLIWVFFQRKKFKQFVVWLYQRVFLYYFGNNLKCLNKRKTIFNRDHTRMC